MLLALAGFVATVTLLVVSVVALFPAWSSHDRNRNFLVFDSRVTNVTAEVTDAYVFVWGADSARRYQSLPFRVATSMYIPYSRDPDGNRNLSWWQAHQPSWVLYRCDRRTPAFLFGDPNIPLDFTNPDVVAWQISNYAALAATEGFDGIAADNVATENGGGACGVFRNISGSVEWVSLFTGNYVDEAWANATATWVETFGRAARATHNMSLVINYSPPCPQLSSAVAVRISLAADAILQEAGFTGYGQGLLSGKCWVDTMNYVAWLQQAGKAFYSVNEWPTNLTFEVDSYLLGTYLMQRGNLSALFASGVQQYGGVLPPSLVTNHSSGTPLSAGPLVDSRGVFYRNYSSFIAVVNPTASAAPVLLDPNWEYRLRNGTVVLPGATIPAVSAMVLHFSD